jgi:predicted XRE-type DNA-binding protein
MKRKARYKLNFKIVKKRYKGIDDTLLANIILNGKKTRYYVGTSGNIYSKYKKTKIMKKLKLTRMRVEKDKDNQYYTAHLSDKGDVYNILIHRLVAGAFIPNPENKAEVNHKDGDKSHNYVDNLEWVTPSENILHAYRTGHKFQYTGEKNHNTKIKQKDAELICKLLEENKLSIREISEIIGCPKTIVMNIIYKYAWREISEKYNIDNYDVKESINGNRRMKRSLAIKICEDLSSGYYSIREIAEKYDIPYSRVNDIKQHKTWTSVSCLYDFSNYLKNKN